MSATTVSIDGFDRTARTSRTRALGMVIALAVAAFAIAATAQAATVVDIEPYEGPRVGRPPGWILQGPRWVSNFDITNSGRGSVFGHFVATGCFRPGGCPSSVTGISANARSVLPGEIVRATDTFGGAVIDGTPSLFGFSGAGVTGWYEASWEVRAGIGYVIFHDGAFDTTAAPITVIPEPTTGLLLGAALAAGVFARRGQRRT